MFVCYITGKLQAMGGFFLNNRTIYVEAEGTINLLQCQVINPVVRKRQQDKGGAGTNQDGDKKKNLSRLYLDQL